MTDAHDDVDAQPLAVYAADAHALDARAFAAKHGDGFLIHEGPIQARRPLRPQTTLMLEKPPSAAEIAAAMAAPPEPPPAPKGVLVFAVRSTGRSPYPRMVTVGRTRNNDIVIADVAISKFHAYFKSEEGGFLVQDAGSRNGTRLDGVVVPDSKKGKPFTLRPSSRLRFGEIEFTFLSGAGLRDLARRVR